MSHDKKAASLRLKPLLLADKIYEQINAQMTLMQKLYVLKEMAKWNRLKPMKMSFGI
jgi:hypothetical protein